MSATPSLPVLDREVALANVGGDEDLLREIAVLFLENYNTWLQEVRDAVLHSDPVALERASHGLKGSVSNFGAQAAFEAAFRLERLGRSRNLGAPEDLAKDLQSLEQALADVRPELEAL